MTRFASWLLAAIAVAVAPAAALAQRQQQTATLSPDGYELFRAILDRADIAPMTTREINRNTRFDDVIVVIVGTPQARTVGRFTPAGFADIATHSGGAVLHADDNTAQFFTPSNGGGTTRIVGGRIAVTRAELGFGGRLDMPLLVPDVARGDRLDLFEGLTRVVTENPSRLGFGVEGTSGKRVLARFPILESVNRANPGRPLEAIDSAFAVADYPDPVWRQPDDFRRLVFASPSVFKNSLMATDSTDNILLAQRAVAYLQGPNKQRKRCAFYENGVLVENFDTVRVMLEPPMPNPLGLLLANQPALTDFGNRILDDVQTRDVPNTLLLGPPDEPERRERRAAGFATAFLVGASVWAAWFLLRRVWKSRQPTDAPPPPFAGGSVTADRSGGVFDRRKRELVRRNNLYEPIREALRELFTAAGATPAKKPPRVGCTEDVRKPGKLREAIFELWKLAYGPPAVVTARRWKELEPVVERLRRELADGTWWFKVEVETPSEA